LRRLAQRRLPRLAFDYIDGGARRRDPPCGRNSPGVLAPHVPAAQRRRDITADLRTTVLGTTLDCIPARARRASSRLFYPRGEVAAAKAADAAGTGVHSVPTVGCRLEDVRAATADRFVWYQVYLVGGR
jgi:L-lactate dehydrogenase (cytochrome)